jgi:alkylhydroperoxidase/carboxymuconolactone decarboxylase family protein YurZ
MLANNLQEKERQLVSIAYDTVRKRVSDTLLKLKDQ